MFKLVTNSQLDQDAVQDIFKWCGIKRDINKERIIALNGLFLHKSSATVVRIR